jgi:hypothetical protein
LAVERIDKDVCTGGCDKRTCAREIEEAPMLEAVTRERLVKTQQAGKGMEGALVICELWKLAVALLLLVLSSRVYKSSINPFINPNPVSSHTPKS